MPAWSRPSAWVSIPRFSLLCARLPWRAAPCFTVGAEADGSLLRAIYPLPVRKSFPKRQAGAVAPAPAASQGKAAGKSARVSD